MDTATSSTTTDSGEQRPGFLQHFDKKEEQNKKAGRKNGPVGPQNISSYIPGIAEGTDFRDYVRLCLICVFKS